MISTTPSSRTSSGVQASYSPEMPRWDALSCGTIPLVPASISSDSMQRHSTSTASTKPCHAEGMSDEVLRTSSQTLHFLVKTCSIGWIVSWKRMGVHILHAHNHISEVRIGPYLVDGYDPNTRTLYEFNGCYFHGCSHCKKDQDELGKVRKMHTVTKENTSKTRVTTWGSFGNTNSSPCRDQSPNWKSSLDKVNPPSFANIVGSPKNPPSSTLCWMIAFSDFWRSISMFHSIYTTISRKCHPSFVTPKSSSKTWDPSCNSTSESITCQTNPAVCSSVVWKLKKIMLS